MDTKKDKQPNLNGAIQEIISPDNLEVKQLTPDQVQSIARPDGSEAKPAELETTELKPLEELTVPDNATVLENSPEAIEPGITDADPIRHALIDEAPDTAEHAERILREITGQSEEIK